MRSESAKSLLDFESQMVNIQIMILCRKITSNSSTLGARKARCTQHYIYFKLYIWSKAQYLQRNTHEKVCSIRHLASLKSQDRKLPFFLFTQRSNPTTTYRQQLQQKSNHLFWSLCMPLSKGKYTIVTCLLINGIKNKVIPICHKP